jgi:hypothetical protein
MSSAAIERLQGEQIELHFEDDSGKVRVTPGDDTLLLLSVEEAIKACRAFKKQLEFKSQFDHLLNALWAWIKPRREKVCQAYLTTRDAGLLFLVVTQAAERDEEFEADITELDIQVANDAAYHLIDLSVLVIPNCPRESVYSFLSRKMALRFVPDGNRK